jgi:SAM-dependent methyltransferase
MTPAEVAGLGGLRDLTLSTARGNVLEVGAGTGFNLSHYPPEVDSIVACEPDARMRGRLEGRAAECPIPVTVIAEGVPGLPFAPESFDTVVCVLVLCTVADQPGALAELRRLTKPDGQLLFLEHVLADTALAHAQRAIAPLWSRAFDGCRLDRDTVAAMRGAGFVVADCERPQLFGRISAGAIVRGRAIVMRRGM